MPTTLPHDDDANRGDQFIQYRGPEASVIAEPHGTGARLPLTTVQQFGGAYQKPYPVADPGTEDPPDDAILRPLAETLAETNALVCWGAACPDCGDVFETPNGLASHHGKQHGGEDGDE